MRRFREGRTEGSWENFLYFVARLYFDSHGEEGREARRRSEAECGVSHIRSTTALRVPAQIIPLSRLQPERMDPRLGDVDADALAAAEGVIVNIDYPLGVAAYNILREVAVDSSMLRGVYVLGKAATLNADVGDVMLSTVVHDEHSGSTYWLDNAFSVDDIAPDLRFGSGLDNQRAVTVKSTFLQNRSYLDFYYREAFTVVEMEAGPVLQRALRDRRRRPPPRERGGELLEAAPGLRDHPLRLRHALHAGAHAGRARAELLRDGLDLRVLARDPAPRPAARGRARLAPRGRADLHVDPVARRLRGGRAGRLRLGHARATRCTRS